MARRAVAYRRSRSSPGESGRRGLAGEESFAARLGAGHRVLPEQVLRRRALRRDRGARVRDLPRPVPFDAGVHRRLPGQRHAQSHRGLFPCSRAVRQVRGRRPGQRDRDALGRVARPAPADRIRSQLRVGAGRGACSPWSASNLLLRTEMRDLGRPMFDNIPILSIICYLPMLRLNPHLPAEGRRADPLVRDRRDANGGRCCVSLATFAVSACCSLVADRRRRRCSSSRRVPGCPVQHRQYYSSASTASACFLVLLTTLLAVLVLPLLLGSAIEQRVKEYYLFHAPARRRACSASSWRSTSSCSTSSGRSCWCRCTS